MMAEIISHILIIPLITTGMLLMAAIGFGVAAVRQPRGIYLPLFAAISMTLLFVTSTAVLAYSVVVGAPEQLLLRRARFYEIAVSWYTLHAPLLVTGTLRLTRHEQAVLRVIEAATIVFLIGLTLVAYFEPDLFISIEQFETTPQGPITTIVGALGRAGILYRVQRITAVVAAVGTLLFVLVYQITRRAGPAPRVLIIGMSIGIYLGISALTWAVRGHYLDPFPPGAFRRSDAAATVFGISAILSYAALFVRQSHDLQRTNQRLTVRQARLQFLAYHDDLTQMHNRRGFEHDLRSALNGTGSSSKHQIGDAFMIDIDYFSDIVDSFGYDVSDHVLIAAGRRIEHEAATFLGDRARVYRSSNHQFALLASEPVEDVARFMRRLRSILSEPVHIDDQQVFLTVSVGHCPVGGPMSDAATVTRGLLRALAAAKSQRNASRSFTATELQNLQARVDLVQQLRVALHKQQLMMVYQPLFTVDGQPYAAEALVRWGRGHAQAPPTPAEFIPAAERSGLIVPLTEWIIKRVVSDLKRVFAAYPDFTAFVNVSAAHVSARSFFGYLTRTTSAAGLASNSIGIEITETSLLGTAAQVPEALAKLRSAGFVVAIDDFGSGYSSLNYLTRVPADVIKIDRSLIQELPSKAAVAIIDSISRLGSHLDLRIVAEGVETREQLQAVRESGITRVQGYLLGKPVASDLLAQLFATSGKA